VFGKPAAANLIGMARKEIRRYMLPQDHLNEAVTAKIFIHYTKFVGGHYGKILNSDEAERIRELVFGAVFQMPMILRGQFPNLGDLDKANRVNQEIEQILITAKNRYKAQ